MLSNLQLKTNIIVNDVERYNPEKFITINQKDIEIVKIPSEIPEDHLIEEMIKYQVVNSGSYKLSPFSYNWNQFDKIYSLLSIFRRVTNQVVLSSCRVDSIARDPYLAHIIDYFGSLNITVAVEGISQGVRNFLQKSLLEKELYKGLDSIIQGGFKSIKIYFIYCGNETEEDLEEFEKFLIKLDGLRKLYDKPFLQIRMSFTPLLSTLGTALQYHSSDISRSLKADQAIIHRIKQLCSRHGYVSRLSNTIPSSEFSQIIEFTDRRVMPLLTYVSLNGVAVVPKFTINFYSGLEQISKGEFNKLGFKDKLKKGKYYYKVGFIDKISSGKLYNLLNERQLYGEVTIFDVLREVRACQGKTPSDFILKIFVRTRREKIQDKLVHVTEGDGEELVYTYKNGKNIYIYKDKVSLSEINLEILKHYLPIVTNGVTYTDIIDRKDALYIFPNMHQRFHPNQHIGTNFRQYMDNCVRLFNSYCLKGVSPFCKTCGKCSTLKDREHITKGEFETGDKDFHLITETQKDMETNQKFLVEINIDSGPPSAMRSEFFRYAINRAVLKASKGEFVKSLIGERTNNTRQGFRVKHKSFKSILGGIFIQEMCLNSGFQISQDYLDDMMTRINQFSTLGWNVTNLKLVSNEYSLNSIDWSWVEYYFDSRKVKDINLDFLRKKVDSFLAGTLNVKYKKQINVNRMNTRTVIEYFDSSNFLLMYCGVGRHKYETCLKMFAKVKNTHPLIFLAGFIGDKHPRAYNVLYGTDIIVKGFYKQPKTVANVFDVQEEIDYSTQCPRCGKGKFINIITGAFGNHYYEQKSVVNERYGSVCQSCFMDLA